MNNKTIWAVLAVIILAGFGIFFYSQNNQTLTIPAAQNSTDQTQTPSTSEAPTTKNMVTYSDSGFSPANLTTKVGDTVTWQNNSSKMMWVASNPHPTHTGLTGFDALQGTEEGQSYLFTFTKTGTFDYHNHLSPKEGGTIIVQ